MFLGYREFTGRVIRDDASNARILRTQTEDIKIDNRLYVEGDLEENALVSYNLGFAQLVAFGSDHLPLRWFKTRCVYLAILAIFAAFIALEFLGVNLFFSAVGIITFAFAVTFFYFNCRLLQKLIRNNREA